MIEFTLTDLLLWVYADTLLQLLLTSTFIFAGSTSKLTTTYFSWL